MKRRRRLRATPAIRDLVRENKVNLEDLIYPVFVMEGENIKSPVDSMPGIFQYSIDRISEELDEVDEAVVLLVTVGLVVVR